MPSSPLPKDQQVWLKAALAEFASKTKWGKPLRVGLPEPEDDADLDSWMTEKKTEWETKYGSACGNDLIKFRKVGVLLIFAQQ